ncbi:kynureninase [Microthyrium microscopicum]|uniref:Kynureninase n=1 Tax=Microthyrium microscopicum TaxID=703497 RepID=A0A6A6TZT3_9PEZI|nr:kynureninase [Microthyrium microscopicum]
MADIFDFGSLETPLSEKTAQKLDSEHGISQREHFVIPTQADLKRRTITASKNDTAQENHKSSIYVCGNSLGLQPKCTKTYIERYLSTWSTQGVYGHFKSLDDELTKPWMNIDDQASAAMAPIVGATPNEVAVMETLTANLHFLLASFYKPTAYKYKILIEGKAFPSDHFAVQSHLAQHNYSAREALVLLEPDDSDKHYFSTQHILDTITEHAGSLALILLPGIHFYSGQFFDIKNITAHAHAHNVLIGWDLAHAAGNVPLQLHDWDVDFAAWCTYKYLNSGPGCIGALFVHDRHTAVANSPEKALESSSAPNDVLTGGLEAEKRFGFRHRLCGWWGSSKTTRFEMDNVFVPIAGAAGWQVSNPSALDTTSVLASLSVFERAGSVVELRKRSVLLTGYLEYLLLNWPTVDGGQRPYTLLTPVNPEERGAQISVRLDPGLLDGVVVDLEAEAVVVDERKPDVIRVAPTPLYNTFSDVWNFVDILSRSLEKRRKAS